MCVRAVLPGKERGEQFKARKGELGGLSICTNLRICHLSGRVFFAGVSRWL